jgi:phage terminase small subunit
MGKPGPKPTPTTLRVLNGDKHKDRYNLNEPDFADLESSFVPTSLNQWPAAVEMWTFLSPRLLAHGLLRDVDSYALEALCVTYGEWRAQPSIRLTTKLQSLLCEFGLTPSSRTRLVGNLPHEKPTGMAGIIGQ